MARIKGGVTSSVALGGAVAVAKSPVSFPPGVGPVAPQSAPAGLIFPSGMLALFAFAVPPAGWLACDGSAVSRSTYADLFTAIGTVFGDGDVTSTFNLPDFRGRVPGGLGTGTGLTDRALADQVGEEGHILTVTELAEHSHGVSDSGHAHNTVDSNNFASVQSGYESPQSSAGLAPADSGSNETSSAGTRVIVNTAGSGGAHNTMQPTLFCAFFIKT